MTGELGVSVILSMKKESKKAIRESMITVSSIVDLLYLKSTLT